MKKYTAIELKVLLDNHLKWLRKESGERANLSYANLRDAHLSDANLTGANLSGADLSYANLHGANLSSANLTGANLHAANLSHAYLSYANLSSANLSYANLRNANLHGADLRNAHLHGANLHGADLSSADLSCRDVKHWSHNVEFMFLGEDFWHPGKDIVKWRHRKPFEEFQTSCGHRVSLDYEFLKVGCQIFTIKDAKVILKSLLENDLCSCYNVHASHRGISYQGGFLKWEDAELIWQKIKDL